MPMTQGGRWDRRGITEERNDERYGYRERGSHTCLRMLNLEVP